MRKNTSKGITLVALVVTIVILLILATISIQSLTNTGLFGNANKAKLEMKRSQIKEWLSLNLFEVQTANYNKTDSEILEIARQNAEKSNELKKLGKTVDVDGEVSTEEDGQTVAPYFYVIVDNDMYKVSMEEQEYTIGDVKQQWKDISSNNYGDYVNYPIDLNNDGNTTNDWKIFYKDSNGYVYLIAKDNQNLYTDILTLAGMKESTQHEYCVYWNNIPQYNEITDSIKARYKMSWNKSKTNDNIKSVSQLLNTNNWKSLVNTNYAIDAIGAPTVEMWVDSWNEKGHKKLYYSNNGDTGYYVGDVENPTTMYIEGLPVDDPLYFPDYLAYWLASPAAGHTGNLLCINNPGISIAYFQFEYWAIRPVVCLRNDISGERINDIWQLK